MKRFSSECRICLSDGDIPIFGEEDETRIAAEIIAFGDIEISRDDGFPQNICSSCYTLLESAILFRNTAQHTDKTLKSVQFSKEKESYVDVVHDLTNLQLKGEPSVNNTKTLDINCKFNTNGSVYKHKTYKVNVSDNEEPLAYKNCNNSEQNSEDFSCDVCCMDFESLEDYEQHTNTKYHIKTQKRANKIPCEICEKLVICSSYKRHVEKHNSEALQRLIFECQICDVKLDSIEEFEMHNSKHHEKNNCSHSSKALSKLECKICNKYISKSYFKIHLKLHGTEQERAERLRTCPFCEKDVSYSYFKDHIRRKHSNNETEGNKKRSYSNGNTMFICDKCGKVFKKKYALQVHILTHGSEMKYKCMFCPYRGVHQELLKTHIRTHTGDYNYKCTKCPGRFLTKSNLSKHLKRHTGPVDYKCNSCDRGFYSKLELDRHYSVQHMGIKSHICDICGKAFGYRNGMMCHQLKVHKRKKLTEGKGRLANYLQSKINNNE